MTKEELIRNLNYTMEKHKNDKVDTFGTNISLMCKDVLDYLKQPCDDCVSRAEVDKLCVRYLKSPTDDHVAFYEEFCSLPPVTPTFPKCTTNGEAIIQAFPNLKYTIQNGRVVTTIGVASSFDIDWWNAPYKRGDEK